MTMRYVAYAFVALCGLTACDQTPRPSQATVTAPMAGTAAGSADSATETAARDIAGGGCPATTQGLGRLATRGEGPVVLRSGPPSGGAQRPGTRESAQAAAIASGGCQ